MKGHFDVRPGLLAVLNDGPVQLKPREKIRREPDPLGCQRSVLNHVHDGEQEQRFVWGFLATDRGRVQIGETVQPLLAVAVLDAGWWHVGSKGGWIVVLDEPIPRYL